MRLRRLLRPAPHLERDTAQHALLVLVSAALALGAAVGIAWAAGFGRVSDELRAVDPIWLPVAFGMEVAAYFGYVVAYREVARAQGGPRLGLRRAGAIVAAGFGVFVVRGGFVVDRHALETAGLEPREARVRVLGLGVLEYAVLAPAAALAAVILLARGTTHPSLGVTLPWAIAVPLGFVAAFAALGLRHRVRDEGGWRAVVRHALEAVNMLRHLAAQGADHGGAFLGTTLYWAADVGCLWACLRAFHESPDLPSLVIGYATGYALTRRTLPLGGAGSVEALVSFALAWAGIPLAQAVLAVCAYRIFNLWLPLLPAAIGLRQLKRWQRAVDPLQRPA
ncbi:MAG: YbhN family protein [Gaiellaceae bacterium]